MQRRHLLTLPLTALILAQAEQAHAFVDPAAAIQRATMIANQVREYAEQAARFTQQAEQWRRELEHIKRNAKKLDARTFESVRRLAYLFEDTRQQTLSLSDTTRRTLEDYARLMKTPESRRMSSAWHGVHNNLDRVLGQMIASRVSSALSVNDRVARTSRVLDHLVDSAQGSQGQLEALGTLSSISGVMAGQLSNMNAELVRTSTEQSIHNAKKLEDDRRAQAVARRFLHAGGRKKKARTFQKPGTYKAPKRQGGGR